MSIKHGKKRSLRRNHRKFSKRAEKFWRKVEKALTADRLKIPIPMETIDCLRGKRDFHSILLASNLPARKKAAAHLEREILGVRRRKEAPDLIHITIMHEPWVTSDEKTIIDLHSAKEVSKRIAKKLCPNFIGMCEVQVSANEKHKDGGKKAVLHTHITGWGHGIAKDAVQASKALRSKLQPIEKGQDAIRVQIVGSSDTDAAAVATYPLKAPDRCKTLYKNKAKKKQNLHESQKGDRYIRYLRMFEILSLMRIDQMMFGHGEGKAIRTSVLAKTQAWLDEVTKDSSPPIREDQVLHFWAEFMPQIGGSRFKLPYIKLRR